MARGKKKLPEIHIRDGTYRQDRHLPDMAKGDPVTQIPMPPPSLHKDAHAIWYSQAAALVEMRTLTSADHILLESFCNEKLKYDRATEALEYDDMIQETNNGSTQMVSLYIKIQNDCLKNMIELSKRFGFDPLSRTSIGVSKSDKKDVFKDDL